MSDHDCETCANEDECLSTQNAALALHLCKIAYSSGIENLAKEVVGAIDSPLEEDHKIIWLGAAFDVIGMTDRQNITTLVMTMDKEVKDKQQLEIVKAHVMASLADRILRNSSLAIDILGGILGMHVDTKLSFGGIIAKPERSRLH